MKKINDESAKNSVKNDSALTDQNTVNAISKRKAGRPKKVESEPRVTELLEKVPGKRGRKPKQISDPILVAESQPELIQHNGHDTDSIPSILTDSNVSVTESKPIQTLQIGQDHPDVIRTNGSDIAVVKEQESIPSAISSNGLEPPNIDQVRVKRPYKKREDRKVHDKSVKVKSSGSQDASEILAGPDHTIPTIEITPEAIKPTAAIEGTALHKAEVIQTDSLDILPTPEELLAEDEPELSEDEIVLMEMLEFASRRKIDLIPSRKDLITMIHILFNVTDQPSLVVKYLKIIFQFNSNIDEPTAEDMVRKFKEDFSTVPDSVRPTLKLLYFNMKKLGYRTDKETAKRLKFNENDLPQLIMEAVYNTIIGQTYLTIKEQISKDMYINDYNKLFRHNQHYNSLSKDDKVPLSHEVENAIVHLVNRKFGTNFSKTKVINHMLDATLIKETNIVKDWLSAANPDDIDIYKLAFDKFLAGIKVKDEGYKESTFIRWMLGVLVNIFDQGFFDEILVFLGGQDIGKTTVITNVLCKFFFDNAIATDSFRWGRGGKDDFRQLYQSAIIVDDELQSLKDADIENIKKFTSESNVKIREHYRRNFSSNKRIASFIGATNNDSVFSDISGGRRFLILDIIEKMDLIECYYDENQKKYIPKTDSNGSVICKFDTDAIWYYIYCLYLKGEKPRDYKRNDQALENYRAKSNVEQIVNDLFVKSKHHITKYSDIVKLLKDFDHSIKITDRNLGNILKKMGCTPKHTKAGNIWNVSQR